MKAHGRFWHPLLTQAGSALWTQDEIYAFGSPGGAALNASARVLGASPSAKHGRAKRSKALRRRCPGHSLLSERVLQAPRHGQKITIPGWNLGRSDPKRPMSVIEMFRQLAQFRIRNWSLDERYKILGTCVRLFRSEPHPNQSAVIIESETCVGRY